MNISQIPGSDPLPNTTDILLQALQQAAVPVIFFYAHNAICGFASDGWRQKICAAAREGAPAEDCFPVAARSLLATLMQDAQRQGQSRSPMFGGTEAGKYWRLDCNFHAQPTHAGFLVWASDCTEAFLEHTQAGILQEKMSLLEHVLHNMEEGVSISDGSGHIIYTNKAEDQMFGYEPGGLYGQHVSVQNAYGQDENAAIVAQVMEVIRSQGFWSGEWHNRRKDRTPFYTYAHITASGEGENFRFICVQRDITREKETMEALQQETKLKQTITDNATATLFMMNAEGYCTFMNPAGEQMFGFSQEEIRSKPLHYLVHHHRPDGSFYPMQECPIDRALPENYDVRAHEDLFFRKDGSTLRVSCAASPIFENGVPVSTVIEVRDITREKEAQERLRRSAEELEIKVRERTSELEVANEQLTQFAYAASHDLQEPLRKIHFFSDRLKQTLGDQLPPSERAMFDRMENATQRMRTLIDDLLSYSHTSLGTTAFETVDLNVLLNEVLEDMEATIAETEARIEKEPLPIVQGNARQLRQLLQNLLSNGIKYAKPESRPELWISARELGATQNGTYEIKVRDNGIGFEQGDADRIFHVFQRLHGRSEYAGTGIGLAIVRKVAENHGGNITAHSQPGLGATFTLSLPRQPLD